MMGLLKDWWILGTAGAAMFCAGTAWLMHDLAWSLLAGVVGYPLSIMIGAGAVVGLMGLFFRR